MCEYPALVCQHGGLQFHEALHRPAYDRTLHSNRYQLGELRVQYTYLKLYLITWLQIDQSEHVCSHAGMGTFSNYGTF